MSRSCGAEGFTLVELLISVAIVSVLASIAVPMLTHFALKARRTEAYVGLQGIHTAQQAYFATYHRYAGSFDDLGFDLDGGLRVDANTIDGRSYRFELVAYEFDGIPNGSFWATATGDLVAGDGVFDVLLVEKNAIVKE